MQRTFPVRLRIAAAVLLLGAAALAAFYFYDLPIAQAVYRPDTLFGSVMDAAAPTVPPLIALFLLLATAQSGVSRPAAVAEWIGAAAAAVLAAGVWVFYLQIYFPIHQAEMAREHSIAQAMARGETEITVVRYPNSAWL